MEIVEKSRTLRPSTRKASSPYRVSTEQVGPEDVLRLTIFDEGQPDRNLIVFEFPGGDIASRASIHFTAKQDEGRWRLQFSEVQPTVVTIE